MHAALHACNGTFTSASLPSSCMQLEVYVNTRERNWLAVLAYLQDAAGRPAIVFCVGIQVKASTAVHKMGTGLAAVHAGPGLHPVWNHTSVLSSLHNIPTLCSMRWTCGMCFWRQGSPVRQCMARVCVTASERRFCTGSGLERLRWVPGRRQLARQHRSAGRACLCGSRMWLHWQWRGSCLETPGHQHQQHAGGKVC